MDFGGAGGNQFSQATKSGPPRPRGIRFSFMSEIFQQALGETIPLLRSVDAGIVRRPKASRRALEELRAAAMKPRDGTAMIWTWERLEEAILGCVKCPHLVASRSKVVFGTGDRNAELMFVGEAPGADEDLQGEPFVGKAGQLLTKIIEAMGFSRAEVFIANVLKCRPDMPPGESGNRKPKPEEMATCLPWLREQIELVRPRALVALGATAAEGLLGETRPLRDIRGTWLDFQGIPVLVTYHPAYLLRNQSITEKRKVWEDMLQVLRKLGKQVSAKQERFFTQPA